MSLFNITVYGHAHELHSVQYERLSVILALRCISCSLRQYGALVLSLTYMLHYLLLSNAARCTALLTCYRSLREA
jgi:hypothetical protein